MVVTYNTAHGMVKIDRRKRRFGEDPLKLPRTVFKRYHAILQHEIYKYLPQFTTFLHHFFHFSLRIGYIEFPNFLWYQ